MTTQATTTDDHLLSVYLHDHLAGAAGGVSLAKHVAKAQRDEPAGPELAGLAREIEQDQVTLRSILRELGISDHAVHEKASVLAEKAAHHKPNGQLVGRSPLDSLVELEAMGMAIEGKRAGWVTLRILAESDSRLDVERLDRLVVRAISQAQLVESLRRAAAQSVLTSNRKA